MSVTQYHSLCQKSIGRCVKITTIDGNVHKGIIERVSANKVFIRPLTPGRNLGGFGYGAYGGFGWGWGWGIALAAIAALAFIPFFFW